MIFINKAYKHVSHMHIYMFVSSIFCIVVCDNQINKKIKLNPFTGDAYSKR